MNEILNINEHNNREGYQSDFDRIAKVLLNCTELITMNEAYRIRELEFYYHSANHTDFYCHNHERQLKNQRLYFHRFKDPKKYARLKRKGLDITLGNEQEKGSGKEIYAGILIRAIENIKTNKIITGIGKLTNQIIVDIGETDSILKLYDEDKNIFDSSSMIYLKTIEENSLPIFKKHRQGLGSEKEDTDQFYLDAKYNYFTYPEIEVLK